MTRTAILCCLLAAFCCLPGCASKPRIELAVASQPNVNPDVTGRPSPLIVKVYELRRDVAFNQADFQTLFTKPMQALSADLVAADELTLVPGEARRIKYKPDQETRFVGVVAGFRNMDRARWRVVKPVEPEGPSFLALEFNNVDILAIPDERASNWDPEAAVKNYEQKTVPPAQTTPLPGQTTTVQGTPAGQTWQSSAGGITQPAVPQPNVPQPGIPQPNMPSVPTAEPPLPAMRTMQ
ncbi:MAG: type VI secretion system lipoprotein TssJ [Proteobacteria bacterium]|nr:type VI secretion system lipoprotein TssJ [Pseudomonadota bacterium]